MLTACDLDALRIVTDALGHAAGDQVLCEVARRPRATVRDRDPVARRGGDEFAILLEGTDENRIAAIEDRLFEVVPKRWFWRQVTLNRDIDSDSDIGLESRAIGKRVANRGRHIDLPTPRHLQLQ